MRIMILNAISRRFLYSFAPIQKNGLDILKLQHLMQIRLINSKVDTGETLKFPLVWYIKMLVISSRTRIRSFQPYVWKLWVLRLKTVIFMVIFVKKMSEVTLELQTRAQLKMCVICFSSSFP